MTVPMVLPGTSALALHIETPLCPSLPLSTLLGVPVYLKLEALQPSGSFKNRGIGALARELVDGGARCLVSSSGGNAGLAVAYAGRRLGVQVHVVLPTTTPAMMHDRLRAEGAVVSRHGADWNAADVLARSLAQAAGAAYLPPFDHPTLWRGHATMMHEAVRQGPKPGMVVLSVGGGGLLCGVIEGLRAIGWGDVPVLAVETEGAASLHAALTAGTLVSLPRIDTVAVTLGARQVAAQALALSQAHAVHSHVVTDAAAIQACARFLDDHRLLVEPACGAALAPLYARAPVLRDVASVLVIVCGGSGVTGALLQEWLRAHA